MVCRQVRLVRAACATVLKEWFSELKIRPPYDRTFDQMRTCRKTGGEQKKYFRFP
jgi:hypothetical protein